MVLSRYIKILMLVAFLAGCATVDTTTVYSQVENEKVFNLSFDKTWAALVEIISDENYSIEAIAKDSGLISTKLMMISWERTEEIAQRHQDWPRHQWWEGAFKLDIFVTDAGNGTTKVKVNPYIKANNTTRGYWEERVPSSGFLENSIFRRIENKIKTP